MSKPRKSGILRKNKREEAMQKENMSKKGSSVYEPPANVGSRTRSDHIGSCKKKRRERAPTKGVVGQEERRFEVEDQG